MNNTRKLTRSRGDRIIAGVAGGVGHYFNIDPMLVRLIFLALALVNGIGIVLYVVMWFLLPNEDSVAVDTRGQVQENFGEMRSMVEQAFERVRGVFTR